MQTKEGGNCQTAGSHKNDALTFMGHAATTDKNLCTVSVGELQCWG